MGARRVNGARAAIASSLAAGWFTSSSFTIVDASTGSLLGHVERSRVYSTVHEGAVYLHGGESFLVSLAMAWKFRRAAQAGVDA